MGTVPMVADWVDDEGAVTTLPTYEQFVRYITGADKEGGRGTENNQSYLDKSLNQILLGNYTGDVTALGTAGQVAAGVFDLDLPMDIRDLSYDITNWESTPEHIGQTVLDAVGLIPIIGMVKYGDEINALLKGTGKNADEAADVAKEADEAAKGAGNAGTVITEIKYKPSSGVIFKANPDKTTTILGSYDKDMKNIVNEMGNVKSTDFGARKGGFNVLNVPDEMYKTSTRQQFWDDINKPWLDEAISRGDDIVLATIPRGRAISYIDTVTGEEVITGFGREYYYLLEKGYIYDAATKTMKLK